MSDAPVLLLHGFGTSAATTWGRNGWIDLLHDLGREVHAPDLLGHGTAPKPHDPEAYDELEREVAADLPPGPLRGLGFSLGARVLLTVASWEPDRFERIVVAGVGENLFRPDSGEQFAQLVQGQPGGADHPMANYFQQLAQAPDADADALAAYLRRPNPIPVTDELLGAVRCPVLVVLGTEDFAGPADPLVERLPDARLLELPGVDHFATPKSFEFIDAALEFLAG